jgi:uracil-DNA glycosylase
MNKQQQLDNLKQKMLQADLPFKDTANNLVFGEGNPNAEIFFIGEAPGRMEDQSGRPFVGQAGRVLEKLIESIGLKREDVFISSVLHYRPPKNRDPKPSEIELEKPFVDEQIKIIDPKIIVPLGRHSMKKFLPKETISASHGQAFQLNRSEKTLTIIPMYHPAAVLYRRELLKTLEQDFQQIKAYL